ncbi:methylmalonyl-CoA mutase [Acrocarpospora phusangensis]|uniref:methylmalonyl-CoA mutase n=1 Tax=Acrocarpospora phusangensis TaxID=1070424 RepID=A0A919QAK5_9ACTN|nr:methylmalonyl-CoA mutase subunit beta [Acrocarpospora phusangensis]GIH23805.1 methylmalonyl-CoA mutase [Acrocarpospora phusangensis]
MTVSPLDLAAGFPPGSRERWRELALGVLRRSGYEGDDPEAALSSATDDGIGIAPLYDRLPAAPRVLPPEAGWDVRQRHADPDPAATRDAIQADLENGVTSLWLDLTSLAPADLPAVLDGVFLDLAPVVLDAGPRTEEAARIFLELASGTALAGGNLGASPLHPGLAGLVHRCAAEQPAVLAVTVDALPYHDAGGGEAAELGCSIAAGVAALRALTDAGVSAEQAFGHLEFRYAATADQFLTIAKLRAARRLWARVAEVCGVPAATQRQHAVTSSAMMTARDPWVNMLRTTLACFGAGTGGADAVTVQPFDAALGLPDGFARRIARNTQSLLVEEAGVARVLDPAGGSYYVENLTAALAERGWSWFQEIERAGGFAAALDTLIPARLAETRTARARDIARRKHPITGVSEFPNLTERPVVRAPGPGLPASPGLVRHAAGYEALRDLADARPTRPAVFLATIGPVAVHTARASFAANLFAAGGIATVTSGPGTDAAAMAEAFRDAGTPVACLCSSDRLYGEHAETVAAALRAAGARRVWLAGKGEYPGVDGTIRAGGDALDVLRTTFADLDIRVHTSEGDGR